MWPAPCEYHRARTVDDAVELLADCPDARVLAGGLSLVPAMRRRRIRPAHLVDINAVRGLAVIGDDGGFVSVGATCRQETLLRWAGNPLLTDALAHTGTAQTRQRGTVAGIVANGEPATQLAAACAVLDATVTLRDTDGAREESAVRLFADGGVPRPALVAAVRFPVWLPADGHAFLQAGRRAVGATIGGVAARVRLDASGTCVRADVAPFLSGHDGSRLPEVADGLLGTGLDDGDLADAADMAAERVRAAGDVLATEDYRRHLVRVLVRRALVMARARARKGS